MFFASSRHVDSNPRTAAAIRAQRMREQQARPLPKTVAPVLPTFKKLSAATRQSFFPPEGKPVKAIQTPETVPVAIDRNEDSFISDDEIRESVARKWQVFLRDVAPLREPTMSATDSSRPDFERILRLVCKVFQITPRDIISASRSRDLILPRQAVYYWASRLTPLSYTAIGVMLGGRDHSTVMYGVEAYRNKRAHAGRRLPRARRKV